MNLTSPHLTTRVATVNLYSTLTHPLSYRKAHFKHKSAMAEAKQAWSKAKGRLARAHEVKALTARALDTVMHMEKPECLASLPELADELETAVKSDPGGP